MGKFKKSYSILFFSIVFVSVVGVQQPLTAVTLKNQLVVERVLRNLYDYHFKPKALDDKLSEDIYDTYLDRLDSGKQFFIQSDIDSFDPYKRHLDDELKIAQYKFEEVASSILNKRIEEVKAFTPELLKTPIDFTEDETIVLDNETLPFANDLDELKERWRKIIKHQTLSSYLGLLDTELKPSQDKTVFYPALEKKAREKVEKNLENSLKRLLQETQEERFARYLETVTNVFDPHSDYFLPQKKEDFDISITGKLEGIGAVLREDDGYIKVVRIVTGSAAWRQKGLEAEDVILKVAQYEGEPESIVGLRVQDAVKLIRGPKGSEVRLTVKKPDGLITVVPIVRDVVVIEETYARSTVIENEKLGHKVGYIYLPGFYRDFKDAKARNSSTDVRRALESLKQQNIEGIILDLRNNGGGALNDAVMMAGLFIDSGPVVQVKDRSRYGNVYRDMDNSVVYDGPLVVLVNSFSASASEILAAALQDYGRAVIVGSSSSYGKGTVQTFRDLDLLLPIDLKDDSDLGSLKVTIQKFYRINGGSTQYKGVIPDIILPFTTDYMDIGEKTLDFSLAWSTVQPLNYQKWTKLGLPVDDLRKKSEERVQKNTTFQLIKEYVAKRKERKDKKDQTLNLAKMMAEQKVLEEENAYFKDLSKNLDYLNVPTPNFTGIRAKEEQSKFKEWKEQIKKDVYIDEATNVIFDIISKNRSEVSKS